MKEPHLKIELKKVPHPVDPTLNRGSGTTKPIIDMSMRQEAREENRGRYTFENPTVARYKVKPVIRIRFRPDRITFHEMSKDRIGMSIAPIAVYTRGKWSYNAYLMERACLTLDRG